MRLLGKGGMGAVYLGQHIIIGRKVAVKFLHSEFAGREEVVKRFYREAQAAAAIGHKNIIDVQDVGVSAENEPYLVMEYLEGESLSGLIKRSGQLDLGAACGIMEPVLQALKAAHEKGIIHRDLKPENIFLAHQKDEPPAVKVIDFGISKFVGTASQNTQLTQTGSLIGTPAYMAPEQARGESGIDHRIDLYAMGVILYEMLTGAHPFVGDNYNTLLLSVLTEPPRPPETVYPNFPTEAGPLLEKALAKIPTDRFQSADELLEALKDFAGFNERQENLTRISSDIKNKSFAGGDLGEELSSQNSSNVASDVLKNVASEATPGGWTNTAGTVARPQKRSGLVLGLAAAAVIAIVVSISLLFVFKPETPPAQVVPVSSPAPSSLPAEPVLGSKSAGSEIVEITVEGAPVQAKVFFNDLRVMENPFPVKKANSIVPLRVEADGFETYKIAVVPSENRTVSVALEPIEAPQKSTPKATKEKRASKRESKKDTSRKQAAKQTTPPSAPSTTGAAKKKKFTKAGRGTVIAEDFE